MIFNILFIIPMVVRVAAGSRYHPNWSPSAKSPVYVPSSASESFANVSPDASPAVMVDRRTLGTSPAWVVSSDDSPQSSPVAIMNVMKSEIGWPTHPKRDESMEDDDSVDEWARSSRDDSPVESPTFDSDDDSVQDDTRRVLGNSPAMTDSLDDSPNSSPNTSPVVDSSEISNDELPSSANLKAEPSPVVDSLVDAPATMTDDDDIVGESPSSSALGVDESPVNDQSFVESSPSLSLDDSPVDDKPSVGTSPSTAEPLNDSPSTSNDESPTLDVEAKMPSYLGDEDRRMLVVI